MFAASPSQRPTRTEVRWFAVVLLALGGVLVGLSLRWPGALWVASGVLLCGWFASLLGRQEARRSATRGLGLPLLFAAGPAGIAGGLPPVAVAGGLGFVMAALALAVLRSHELGAEARRGWIAAAEPMRWSLSRLILGFVYFLVLTPIALVLRAAGRDALGLRRRGASHWVEVRTPRPLDRYLRQF
jgi:hypothetical protein